MLTLHTRSLQYNQQTYQHAKAIMLATDLLDRLHINQTIALTTDSYQLSVDQTTTARCTRKSYPSQCEQNQCTPSQLAAFDKQQWQFQLACQLPNATGSIRYENVPSGTPLYP